MDYKYHFKVILVGNAGVGKTAMIRRFTRGFFPFQEAPTIGVDMNVKTVLVDGEKVKVIVHTSFLQRVHTFFLLGVLISNLQDRKITHFSMKRLP